MSSSDDEAEVENLLEELGVPAMGGTVKVFYYREDLEALEVENRRLAERVKALEAEVRVLRGRRGRLLPWRRRDHSVGEGKP